MLARVTFARTEDLAVCREQQFAHGGLFVKATPPEELESGQVVELELVTPSGRHRVQGHVIQALPGGVAVGFAADDPAIEQAAAPGEPLPQDQPVTFEWVCADGTREIEPPRELRTEETPFSRIKKANKREKMHMALHGNKSERAAVLRDHDKSLHVLVLRNPGTRLDEITAMCRNSSIAPDVFKAISERREWFQRPEIAAAMVRNPKCPTGIAIRVIPYVADRDLRQMSKSSSLRGPVLSAVRKKLLR